MASSPIEIARALHLGLESGRSQAELRSLFTEDARLTEHPNSIKPSGARADLSQLLQAATLGAELLSKQHYEVHSAIEHGDLAILRLTWSGTVASDVGSFSAGQELTAHVAQFIHCRWGKIASIETFDCYEPF